MTPRTRSLSIAGGLALALVLPFLVAQTGPQGGLPSKPRFTAVGIGVAAPSSGLSTTGEILQTSSGPVIRQNESDAAADEKQWRLVANGGDFSLQTRTDANGAGASPINITRTGTTVDAIQLVGTTVTINGAAPVTSLFAVTTADTSRASTTTPTDDPTLTFTLDAGVTYTVAGVLIVDSTSATPDFKFEWTRPTLQAYSKFRYDTVEQSVGAIATSANQQSFATIPVVPLTVNNDHGITLNGSLTTTASGTFALAWAQNTSDAAATVLQDGSWIRLTRVN